VWQSIENIEKPLDSVSCIERCDY